MCGGHVEPVRPSVSPTMSSAPVEVAPKAYRKMVYHAAKYVSTTVMGVLVGTSAERVDDVIPLVHHWHTLSPMVEAGMAMTEAHLRTTKQRIIGVYEVPEQLAQRDVSPTTAALAESLAAKDGAPVLVLQLNGTALQNVVGAIDAKVQGRTVQVRVPQPESLALALRQELAQGAFKFVYDWDDHLENTQLDWLTNPDLAE